jgi:hypothetical protein
MPVCKPLPEREGSGTPRAAVRMQAADLFEQRVPARLWQVEELAQAAFDGVDCVVGDEAEVG